MQQQNSSMRVGESESERMRRAERTSRNLFTRNTRGILRSLRRISGLDGTQTLTGTDRAEEQHQERVSLRRNPHLDGNAIHDTTLAEFLQYVVCTRRSRGRSG